MEKLAELLQAILEEIREIKTDISKLNEKAGNISTESQFINENIERISSEVQTLRENSDNLWKTIGDTVGGDLHHNMKDIIDVLNEICSKLT